jgi:hypothetical protein
MKKILLLLLTWSLSWTLYAQNNQSKSDMSSKLNTAYFNEKMVYIQKYFDKGKYNGAIDRVKNLLVTHSKYNQEGLHKVYTILITSFCIMNYKDQIIIYKEKAIENGVDVDSLIEKYDVNMHEEVISKIKPINFSAIEIVVGDRFGFNDISSLKLANYTLGINFKKFYYQTPKGNFIFNAGINYYYSDFPIYDDYLKLQFIDGKLATIGLKYLSTNLGFGYDIPIHKKAKVRMAPTVNFALGSYLNNYRLRFKMIVGLDLEKRIGQNKDQFGVGITYSIMVDNYNAHYVGAFLRYYFK